MREGTPRRFEPTVIEGGKKLSPKELREKVSGLIQRFDLVTSAIVDDTEFFQDENEPVTVYSVNRTTHITPAKIEQELSILIRGGDYGWREVFLNASRARSNGVFKQGKVRYITRSMSGEQFEDDTQGALERIENLLGMLEDR